MNHKPSYDELLAKLAELEEILGALRNEEVDAVVGTKNILMLRLCEAEEVLRKGKEQVEGQAAQLKATMDAAPAIIWTAHDRDCLNITGNQAAHDFSGVKEGINLSKTGPKRELSENSRVFRDGVELQPSDMPMQVAARTGQKILDCALDFHFADGSIRSILGNVTPVMDARGRPSGAIAAFLDVTDRKREEMALEEKTQQLEDANKELERFNYSISHDLRAPLRAIDGYSRMILSKHANELSEEARSKFDVIRANVQGMGQLLEDLLAFSRTGRVELHSATLNIGGLIGEVWEEIKAANPHRGLTLKLAEIPPCKGDRVLIKQVFVNVLSNAVKFTKRLAEARIEAGGHKEDGKIVYYIRDNGAGFDMKYHDKLFGVFQRLHNDVEFEGTGVGLAIVQRIINRHGGRIWAEGAVDNGATFYFTLPTVKE